jgi:hypothetical protein
MQEGIILIGADSSRFSRGTGRIERRVILSQPIVIACHSKEAVWLVSPVGKDRFVRIRVTKLWRLSFRY